MGHRTNTQTAGADQCGCPQKSGGNRWPLSSACPSLEGSAATTFRWGTAAGSGCSPPPQKGPHLHPRSVWNLTEKNTNTGVNVKAFIQMSQTKAGAELQNCVFFCDEIQFDGDGMRSNLIPVCYRLCGSLLLICLAKSLRE